MGFWNNLVNDLHQASRVLSAVPVVGTTVNIATSLATNPSINPSVSPSTDVVGQTLTTANQTVATTVSDTTLKVVKSKQAKNTAKIALTNVSPGLSLAYDLASNTPQTANDLTSSSDNTPLDPNTTTFSNSSSSLLLIAIVGVAVFVMIS